MKTVLTICASLLIVFGMQAQKKPSVTKAKSLWEKGILDQAKDMIDQASTFEKMKDDGKTWYYRGLIYATIDTTSNPAYDGLKQNALDIALQSFKKADELGDPDKDYFIYGPMGLPTTKTQQISGYYAYYFDKAAEAYQNDDLQTASEYFETASLISEEDTLALSNAAYSAQASENYDRSIELFKRTIERGANGLPTYVNLIRMLQHTKKQDEALAVISEAKKLYPEDNGLNRTEVSILLDQGKQDVAVSQLKEAISREPNDVVLRYVLGILYEEMKDKEAALLAYEEALKINPDHYESNFNKAVILFNNANELYKQKGLLGYSAADQKKAKEMEPNIKAAFLKSLPAWEKVYSLNAKDRSALESMVFIYAYLGEEKKADKVEAELIALGEDDGN